MVCAIKFNRNKMRYVCMKAQEYDTLVKFLLPADRRFYFVKVYAITAHGTLLRLLLLWFTD